MSSFMHFFASTGSSAAPITRESPLSRIVAGAVFDLDATLAASYDGTSQIWNNIIPSPADGSATSAYNVTRGAGSGASTDDPTFVGAADAPSAYFNFDGGDFFQLEGDNTAFLNSLHRTDVTQPFTLIYALRVPAGYAAAMGICTSRGLYAGAGNQGVGQLIHPTLTAMGINGDTAAVRTTSATAAGNDDYLIIDSYNPATNTWRRWINGTASTGTLTKNASVNNPPDAKMRIGSYANSVGFSTNNTRYYAASAFNVFIDSTQAAAIKAQYELRHGRTY